MALTPLSIEGFSGLNLRDDPAEVGLNGAVDLLNVDFDRAGRIRQRDGYASFSTATTAPYYLTAWPNQLTPSHIIVGAATTRAIDITTGASAASVAQFAQRGVTLNSTSGPVMYLPAPSGTAVKWNGTAFSTVAAIPVSSFMASSPLDNRLVVANLTSYPSRVQFSDPGAFETWGANNYVDLLSTPDGSGITGAVTWQGQLFIFKGESFYVFYGNSTDSTGEPVFNYRAVQGVGASEGAVAGPDGVYFANANGVWRTTGGPPEKISGQLDPLFTGTPATFFADTTPINKTLGSPAWFGDRLYVPYRQADVNTYTSDRLLVWDSVLRTWTVWNIGHFDDILPLRPLTSSTLGWDKESLFFADHETDKVHRLSSASTTDAGTSITSRYRSGFSDLGGPGVEKTIRQTELVGQGTVSFGLCRDFGSITTTSTANVTLGTAPATARALHRLSQNGEMLGYQIGSVNGGAWQVNRLTPMVRPFRQPGDKSS